MRLRRPTPPRRLGALGTALAAVAVGILAGPAGSAAAVGGPPLATAQATLDAALHCPASYPHTDKAPVLLVHGTGVDAVMNWEWNYAPALRGQGFDVCTVDLPGKATGDIQTAAEYVVNAIDRIQAAAGRKIDVIAHSQGNLEVRWALKFWPELQGDVDDFVSLGGPVHGTTQGNLFCVLPCAPAATQMSVGSNFLAALNSGDETPGSVSYTSIYTRDDVVVTPFWTAAMDGARNITVQDLCGVRAVTHVGLLYDSVTYELAVDALTHSGTADPGRLPWYRCLDDPYVPGVSAADLAYAAAVVDPSAAVALAAAPAVWNEPPLRPYAR
ncbi:esterase/lipase family protein [Yinghuangia soli]|uniref:Lipase family protein n=1 Tax=Yinghuangia soli TaxID=2908204 RepID=A0AA41QAA7_9ACTN|nr:lipase family protein [Yinghuangia soli]MCF2533631.1 lipase family protein [Yinghuangia soli]